LGYRLHSCKIFRVHPEIAHTHARRITPHEVEALSYQPGIEQRLFLLGRGERGIHIFKKEEIPRIQDQNLFLGLLGILYHRCPSGKTARF
jgi:hypothetical protein